MSKVNWTKIKTEYINGNISQNDLADKYKVARTTLQTRARAEKWTELRKQKREKTVEKAVQKSIDRESDGLATILSSVRSLEKMARKITEDEEQLNRWIVPEKEFGKETMTETSVEKTFRKADARAFNDLVKGLQGLERLERSICNIYTAAEKQRMEIERERWELEKKRAEAEETADKTITIRFEDEDINDYAD